MKEKFYNTVGHNTVRILVNCLAGDIELYYHLNDNPVQHIWQELHSDSTAFTMGISHSIDFDIALDKLNELCIKVGYPVLTSITQQALNELHNRFVTENTTQNWLDINFYIHALENRLSSKYADYDTSIVFYKSPIPISVALIEEHKLWLTTEQRWGRLLLGYETIGKDWIDIAHNHDNLTDLSIQKKIGSETLMVFNSEQPYSYGDAIDFYRWAKKSTYNIPLDNLNKLALGRYILGDLIITDTFLNYHPTASDWYVPNHKCRLTWNRDIIGSSPIVKEVKFFTSDMQLETILRHTDV